MYKNGIIKIEKKKGKYSLRVKNYLDNSFFINSFVETFFSCKSVLSGDIKVDLIVSEIISLEDLIKKGMTMELLELLFNSMVEQLKQLEQTNNTISNFSPKHIYLFKSKIIESVDKFIFLNIKDVYEMDNGKLLIDKPFHIKKNMAPEFKKVKKIPNRTVTKTAAYWSLADLIQNILNKKLDKKLDIRGTKMDIRGTKLYWALKRCLIKEENHRFLLLI
tara:strand:- start:1623 stop:2279 length:657 start_codon:yes stop_codon:yes gene_type:complete